MADVEKKSTHLPFPNDASGLKMREEGKFDIKKLASQVAKKRRSGYGFIHAMNSTLWDYRRLLLPEEFEKLRKAVNKEVSHRGGIKSGKAREKRKRYEEILKAKRIREAEEMADGRRDDLLSDP